MTLSSGAKTQAMPAPYEMRPLRTEQDRDAVAELLAQRTQWLIDHNLIPPYLGDAAVLYREQWVDAVALFEGGLPAGCLRLNRQPALPYWSAESDEPSLLVSLAYTAPGRKSDMIGRLMTLWAQHFARRAGMTWVRCEVPSGAPSSDGSLRLVDHLKDGCGWQFVRSLKDTDNRPLTLLQLPATPRPGLEALIHCAVPLHPAANVTEEPVRSEAG
ncbi:hypothetical protein [Streptomyces sp. NPDC058268]|uniref:hypothetical protein n=1 Tax=Streptomyces sp. NPDC058268 TaxID=3346413 RepID=UPI0036E57DBC